MTAKEIVADLVFVNYSVQRDLGATYRSCLHPLAFGTDAEALEVRYQGERGCSCDEPDCNRCYPPALEFVPAERPATGAAEPDDYFE